MRDPKNIDPAVKAAVLAWARAKNLEAANRALRDAAQKLDAIRAKDLRACVAELSAESLIAMLEDPRGLRGGETVEVFGLQLEQVQIERFVAWARDQSGTADALGVSLEKWSKEIERAVAAELCTSSSAKKIEPSAVADVICNVALAERTIGRARAHFENRPKPGSSASSGLRGILRAKAFRN